METSPRKCVAPFYAVAVLWLAAGALVPLYEPMHYGLLAAVSVVVFLAVNALCRCASPEDASSPKAAPAPGSEAAAPAQAPATGNPDLDKILKDGQLAISEMKRLDANIADPGIAGYCYTQLTDVEQEENGVYCYDRTPKVPGGDLKRIFGKKPAWDKTK